LFLTGALLHDDNHGELPGWKKGNLLEEARPPAILIFFQPQKKENHGRSGIGPPVVCPVRRLFSALHQWTFTPGRRPKPKAPPKAKVKKSNGGKKHRIL
jgi:hypothetical protein